MTSNSDRTDDSPWLSDPEVRAWLTRHAGGEPVRTERVQSLWSGFGEIVRVHLQGAPVSSVIVKRVDPPETMQHPRGWSGQASQDRKRRSFEVERAFYANWIPSPTGSHRTARCYSAESTDSGWRFLLEDLDASGYADRRTELSGPDLDRCLRWLASFHAHFLGCSPTDLWPTGTYWHLATRREEFEALTDPQLRDAAETLDRILDECRHRTLVHGDAKVANFCFGPEDVAAVDFQYVGGGCGIKDVAYFLSSCLSDAECEAQAPRHLDTYFAHFRRFARSDVDAMEVEREWRSLYAAAWADFHRFLAGWAPDHWKIHDYTRRMTREALGQLER